MHADITPSSQPFRCQSCSKLLCKGSFIGVVQIKCKRCGLLAIFTMEKEATNAILEPAVGLNLKPAAIVTANPVASQIAPEIIA